MDKIFSRGRFVTSTSTYRTLHVIAVFVAEGTLTVEAQVRRFCESRASWSLRDLISKIGPSYSETTSNGAASNPLSTVHNWSPRLSPIELVNYKLDKIIMAKLSTNLTAS